MTARFVTRSVTVPIANFDFGAAIKTALQQVQAGLATQNMAGSALDFRVQVDGAGNVTFSYQVLVWPAGGQPDLSF